MTDSLLHSVNKSAEKSDLERELYKYIKPQCNTVGAITATYISARGGHTLRQTHIKWPHFKSMFL